MALSEASNPAPGSDSHHSALENVGKRGDGAKEEGNDLERTPVRRLPVFEKRRDEDSSRDGFPRGFSASSSRLGSRRMASMDRGKDNPEEIMMTPEMESSRSLAVYFDSEQMDRSLLVDDSPVYGSVRTELTPELVSLQANGALGSDDSDAENPLKRSTLFSKRKNSPAENVAPPDTQVPIKSQLHADFVLGADRAHDSRREGYITSRLFAKPLSGRVNHRIPSSFITSLFQN